MKILVVDDEPSVVDTLSDFLQDCGHSTVAAIDGLNALETMSHHADVGLVVADVRMPRMDGIEFLKTLKVRYPGVPAILITGHGDEGLAVAALQEGATDYVKKPIKLRELRASVAKVEERHALEAMILSGLEREPAVTAPTFDSHTLEELKCMNQELEALGQLWEAVRPHLEVKSEAEEEHQIVDFAMDEIPATLVKLHLRLDKLIKAQDGNQSATEGPTSLF